MMDVQKGKVSFECDGCAEVLETNVAEFGAAQAVRKAEGWSARPPEAPKGSWEHFCPKCQKVSTK